MSKPKETPENTTPAPAPTPTFKVKSRVTLPFRSWADGEEKALKFLTPAFVGKAVESKKGTEGTQRPANLARCIDLMNGEVVEVIVGDVLLGTLTENYPMNGYVGRAFLISKETVAGKRYKTYRVSEIEDPAPGLTAETENATLPSDAVLANVTPH